MFYAMTNIDKILVGRLLGEVAWELYGQAFNLAMKPVNLGDDAVDRHHATGISRRPTAGSITNWCWAPIGPSP